MSKKNLESILEQISVKAVNSRQNFNTEIHKYTVVYDKILDEVFDQVSNSKTKINIPKEILRGAVRAYTQDIYDKFTKYKGSDQASFTVNVLGSSQSFIVLVRRNGDTSGDVFSFIKRHRNPSLDKLKVTLIRTIIGYLKERKAYTQKKEENLRTSVRGSKTVSNNVAGGLLEMGHTEGSSVIEHELFEPNLKLSENIRALPVAQATTAIQTLAKLDFKLITNPKEAGKLRNGKIVVSIFDQGKDANNVQSTGEANLRKRFQDAMKAILSEVDFVGLEGSPNVYDILTGKIHKQAQKLGAKGVNKTLIGIADKEFTSSAVRQIKTRLMTSTINESLKGAIKLDSLPIVEVTSGRNWASLIPIINAQLEQTVASNMVYPRLVNRTGRFASSVRVIGVQETPQGFPSFVYDYKRDPYDVFDRYKGAFPWNTPQRDPKVLIDMSIREIVREMAIGRFYLRRAA